MGMEIDKQKAPAPVAPVFDASKLDTASQAPDKRKVKIVLEDNAEIPPTGQFISINGRAYVLRAGEEAWVPVELLTVLDSAVMSMPILENDQIVGFRDRKRFPYSVIERELN